MIDGQVDAARPAVLVAVAPDRLADRRRVHDGQHLRQMTDQEAVKEHLVPVVDLSQQHVLRQVIGLALVLRVDPGHLLVERHVSGRYQPGNPKLMPL